MAVGIHKYTVQESQNTALGQAGAKFISDNAAHTGTFVAITMLEDTEFSVLTPEDTTNGYGVGSYNGNNMSGETIPQGVTIYGRWTTVDLVSGLVVAYLG